MKCAHFLVRLYYYFSALGHAHFFKTLKPQMIPLRCAKYLSFVAYLLTELWRSALCFYVELLCGRGNEPIPRNALTQCAWKHVHQATTRYQSF